MRVHTTAGTPRAPRMAASTIFRTPREYRIAVFTRNVSDLITDILPTRILQPPEWKNFPTPRMIRLRNLGNLSVNSNKEYLPHKKKPIWKQWNLSAFPYTKQ
jgi:hypothetical protein